MSTTATLLQLAAELTLFLVAVAGAGLSLRDGLLGLDRAARLLLVAGFLTLAAGAFLVGSLTIDRAADPGALAAVRGAGAALVALGAIRWAGSRVGRPVLLGGLGLLAVAAALDAAGVDLGPEGVGAEPLVHLAALAMGAALVVAGRHTIPGRIGTSVAGVLLGVILLVSLSLSAVISSTVEDEALRRYGATASAEATAATATAEAALDEASLISASAAARLGPELTALADAEGDPAAAAAARTRVTEAVTALVGPDGLAVDVPVVVVSPDGAPEVAVPEDLDRSTRLAFGGDPVVREALDVDGPRQGVTVIGAAAFAVAAVPIRVSDDEARRTVGAVVVAHPLDAPYLARRSAGSDVVSYALVARDGVVATAGTQPARDELRRRARRVIDTGRPYDGTAAGRFVVVRPVADEGLPPELALVLSTPTERVGRTREDLYRSLFLVALAAGLAGIALAVVVGERIGGAIRRLTAAAARIREGDLDARAAVDREDELGELSTTFDSMAASVHDLTDDLRRSAAAERGLRSRLESVFAGVTEAVVAADDAGRVTELNRAAEELLGLPADHGVVGRPLDEVVPLVGSDGAPLDLRADDGRARFLAGTVAAAGADDGPPTSVPVVGTVASLRDVGGATSGTVVVLRDVRQEQALEDAKQEFLANIGHELRTPLTPIKGYAGVLRRRTPSPEQAREWADGITSGVDRLEHLVERLVTFAAVTAGPATDAVRRRDPIDPGALVREAAAGWERVLGPGRTLEVAVADDVPAVVGEEAHLRLAVGELVDNAGRFSRAGAPVRVVVAAEATGDREWVSFAVHDGGGSDVSGLDAVVEAFAQGDASATRSHDGLGLGLALTERIARSHGGRLVIEASSQGGTRVSILVPVVTTAGGPPAPDEALPVDEAAPLGGPA